MDNNVLDLVSTICKVSPFILIAVLLICGKKTKKRNDPDHEERDFAFRNPTASEMEVAEQLIEQRKKNLMWLNVAMIPLELFFILGVIYSFVSRPSNISVIGGADSPTFYFIASKIMPFACLAFAAVLGHIAGIVLLTGRIKELKNGEFTVFTGTITDKDMHRGSRGGSYYRLTVEGSGAVDEFLTNAENYNRALVGKQCLIVRYNSEDKVNENRRTDRKVKQREVIPL